MLLEKREDGIDEVGCKCASAEQADADQCEADGVTGQGQHEYLRTSVAGATDVPAELVVAKPLIRNEIRRLPDGRRRRRGRKTAQFWRADLETVIAA